MVRSGKKRIDSSQDSFEMEREARSKMKKPEEEPVPEETTITMEGMRALFCEFSSKQEREYQVLSNKVDNLAGRLKEDVEQAVKEAINKRLPDLERNLSKSLELKTAEIKAEVDVKVENMTKQLEELKAYGADPGVSLKEVDSRINQAHKDWNDARFMERNVMIKGMVEPDSRSTKENAALDDHTVRSLIREAGLEGSILIKSVSRRGDKKEGWPRLIRVSFGSMDQRDMFLHRVRMIHPPDGPITFSIDRPKAERDEYKRLQAELKEKHDAGDLSWEIRRQRLVKKKPFREDPPQATGGW